MLPPLTSGAWIFERDEYLFFGFVIDLESTRGDV
jgi:hypothetical protein